MGSTNGTQWYKNKREKNTQEGLEFRGLGGGSGRSCEWGVKGDYDQPVMYEHVKFSG